MAGRPTARIALCKVNKRSRQEKPEYVWPRPRARYGRTLIAAAEQMRDARTVGTALGFTERTHPVAQRLKRILDPKLYRAPKLSAPAMIATAILAIAILPGLRSAAERPPAAAAQPPAEWEDIVKLTVLDEETGQPIPEASVTAQIGSLAAKYPYKADQNGRVNVQFDASVHQWFQMVVSAPGYVRMTSQHHTASGVTKLPAALEYRLPRATTVGGVVRDEEGNPVPAAKVQVNLPYGVSIPSPIPQDSAADAEGRWRTDVPKRLEGYSLSVTHPDFAPFDYQSRGSLPTEQQLREQAAVIVLRKGAVIEGVVTDDTGAAIKGATVYFGPLLMLGKSAKTDAEGRYRLSNIEPQTTMLTVSAPGREPQMRAVEAKSGVLHEDFRLGPGHTIRGQVVGRGGEPIPGVDVWIGHWGPYQTLDYKFKTDADGRFEWRDAPADPVVIRFFKDGYLNIEKPLEPRDEPHSIALLPKFRVSGSVTDTQTGKPIEKFKVVPGIGWPQSENIYWADYNAGEQTAGRYEIVFKESRDRHYVRIEAPGYKPSVSRPLNEADGDTQHDFELVVAPNIAGRILLPDGQAATQATVMMQRSAEVVPFTSGQAPRNLNATLHYVTRDDGRFTFPPQDDGWRIVVFHRDGYGEADATALNDASDIRLQPWARIEGVLRIGSKPGGSEKIFLWEIDFDPNIWHYPRSNYTHTDEHGRFAFDWVRPGFIGVGRQVNYSDGNTLIEQRAHLVAKPGETIKLTLGGTGRPVVGRVAGGVSGRHTMTLASIDRQLEALEPKGLDKLNFMERVKRWRDWLDTAEGRAYSELRKRLLVERSGLYTFSVEPDGTFRIEDVPSGEYVIRIRTYTLHDPVAAGDLTFTVPPIPGGRSDEPLDAGKIELVLPDAPKDVGR